MDVGLKFERSDRFDRLISGYVDSDYVGDYDKHQSTMVYVFTMAGGPVSW